LSGCFLSFESAAEAWPFVLCQFSHNKLSCHPRHSPPADLSVLAVISDHRGTTGFDLFRSRYLGPVFSGILSFSTWQIGDPYRRCCFFNVTDIPCLVYYVKSSCLDTIQSSSSSNSPNGPFLPLLVPALNNGLPPSVGKCCSLTARSPFSNPMKSPRSYKTSSGLSPFLSHYSPRY